ncbi:MAG: dihydroxyacetone kinase subunit DhaL [Brevinema sp.]
MKVIGINSLKIILKEITLVCKENEQELCRLDAIIGDGDHGTTMCRGVSAGWNTIEALDAQTPRELIMDFGKKFIATAGGAIGPIFGTFFVELGRSLDGNTVTMENFINGLKRSHEKITELGGAHLGDKTLLDVLIPVYEATNSAYQENKELTAILQIGIDTTTSSLEATQKLQAKRGRAKFLQEGSIGEIDAGAKSFSLVLLVFFNNWSFLGE